MGLDCLFPDAFRLIRCRLRFRLFRPEGSKVFQGVAIRVQFGEGRVFVLFTSSCGLPRPPVFCERNIKTSNPKGPLSKFFSKCFPPLPLLQSGTPMGSPFEAPGGRDKFSRDLQLFLQVRFPGARGSTGGLDHCGGVNPYHFRPFD